MITALRCIVTLICFVLASSAMAHHTVNFGGCGRQPIGSFASQTHAFMVVNLSGERWVGGTWCGGGAQNCPLDEPCPNRFTAYSGPGLSSTTANEIRITGLSVPHNTQYNASITYTSGLGCATYFDPVCESEVPATVGEASRPLDPADQMLASRDPSTGAIEVSYVPACGAGDHTIYFGDLAEVSSYGYSGQVCGIGTSGTVGFTPAGGDLFFLVVGENGTSEGSYGRDGSNGERPEDTGSLSCDVPQDLANTCDP